MRNEHNQILFKSLQVSVLRIREDAQLFIAAQCRDLLAFFLEFIMQGWVKLHRRLLSWEWYQNSDMVHLFVHLLMKANHEPKPWQGITVGKGQLIAGRKKLSADTGLSEGKVRACLDRLVATSEITIKATNRFSVITLLNWDTYQSQEDAQQPAEQPASAPTNNQPANQPTTTNKKVKKKEKKKINKKESKTPPFPLVLDTQEFRDTWAEWYQFRREIKKKLTPTTIVKQFNMLSKYTVETAISTINASIQNGWQGLFPEKHDERKTIQPGKREYQEESITAETSNYGTVFNVD